MLNRDTLRQEHVEEKHTVVVLCCGGIDGVCVCVCMCALIYSSDTTMSPKTSSLPQQLLLPMPPVVVIKVSGIVSFRLLSLALTELTAAYFPLTHLHVEVCLFTQAVSLRTVAASDHRSCLVMVLPLDSLGQCVSALSKRFAAAESIQDSAVHFLSHSHRDKNSEIRHRKDAHHLQADAPKVRVSANMAAIVET